MKKVMLVFGTRPEAVKMCPLAIELLSRTEMRVLVCVTGQHRHLLDQVLEVFGIHPDYDLGIMKDGQSLSDIHTAVIQGLVPVLIREAPDLVLVHGDTSTAFAAALACFHLHVPVGHVEAGLRTRDLQNPFPEEFNRQAVDLICRYHFAPTEEAAENLIREGRDPACVLVTGNTGIDAFRYTLKKEFRHPELDRAADGKLILITAHRRENLGEPMRQIFRGIRRVLETHPACRAVLSLHANPAVRLAAAEELSDCRRIRIIEPPDVAVWHNLEARCCMCLTDSGGVQEECAFLGRPVLVLRNGTERPEGMKAGTARLAGTTEESVIRAFSEVLDDPETYKAMCRPCTAYGDGHASARIADFLMREGQTDGIRDQEPAGSTGKGCTKVP